VNYYWGRSATIKGVGAPLEDSDAKTVWFLLDGASGISYGYPTEEGDFSSLPD
jgi:hypothetical protein